ncbi:hypothetical protein CORT_0A00790 [Candida orthopsilosis Co 90-125]|uniref:SAM-dependent MTase RsmB/NOP-type domain-containing protein n=1 Tax=Candida orthopsilosis (strain 90-125) TaxID=1136231 RepID=H8WVJ7_CANO9|nr:hypothetical protein CORT_0A00790 [Candida orthopsilosis Co 90-125]CCG20470.1 hypothetical protein CORT_0A00790 [Candida orthopsilosis Co 90-125]
MKLYFDAEKFLKYNDGSLQKRIFNDKHINNPKHVYALVYSTIKYNEYIQQIIKKSKIQKELKTKISNELLSLLVHDLIFSSRGRIESGKHPIKEAVLAHKTRLQAEFIKLKLKYKVKSVQQLPTKDNDDETPVRWFRINSIKIDPERFFKKHAFFSKLQPVNSFQDLTEPGFIYADDHIPNLYGIHPKEKLSLTEAYRLGEVIIQDRASCFPAHILNHNKEHVKIIDACAAPGNKTSHAASYLPHDEKSVIYGVERDEKRVGILRKMSERALGKSKKKLIQVLHNDFTKINPEDFPDVTGLIVDPSCSGSGIFGRASDEEESNDQRLEKLASFQVIIMKHALSFPNARKVVYSTCSIHAEENERVVIDLLSDPQVQAQGWKLASREEVLPTWERRGIESEFVALSRDAEVCKQLASGCVRSSPKEDGGIGFFAACFVRDAKEVRAKEEAGDEEDEEQWAGFE